LAALLGRAGIVPVEQAAPLYVRDKVALTVAERLVRGNRA
jgi:tRNA threonylcarbamoyladenosine biosynthesis protein TsaB